MSEKAKILTIIISFTVFAYYFLIAYILRYSIDQFVFPPNTIITSNEDEHFSVVGDDGSSLLIRRYGPDQKDCVVFFPGQHGGVAKYQIDLFPALVASQLTVYAISYPGQDGAKGTASFDKLPSLLDLALNEIEKSCPISNSVFLGRSLGSMVATFTANRWKPRGIVLEAISPSFSYAIYIHMKHKWYLYPALLLPIDKLLKTDFIMSEALDNIKEKHIVVFQGALDTRTPLLPALKLVENRPNIEFIKVEGASHSNSYVVAGKRYIEAIKLFLQNT